MAYDNNQFEEQIGSNSHKWGIRIEPVNLAYFEGQPLTHIEMFDCSEGHYTYSIYNGEQVNNNTLVYTQQHDMEGSHEWVRFALDESVSYDATLPLWVCVASSGATQPIPCCTYVGEPNSCLLKQGNFWKPATDFGQYVSWMLRVYTAPARGRSFTYNVYWGPEEGSEEQMVLGLEGLTTTEAANNTTENTRYNVTAVWDNRETDFSNTIYLGPSVGVSDNSIVTEGVEVFPNPVEGMLTVEGEGLRRVTVYSLQGAKLTEREATGEKTSLDLSVYPAGLYIVTVLTD